MQVRRQLFPAPDIQEEALLSTSGPKGGAIVSPRCIRRVRAEAEWEKQRELWRGSLSQGFTGHFVGIQGKTLISSPSPDRRKE